MNKAFLLLLIALGGLVAVGVFLNHQTMSFDQGREEMPGVAEPAVPNPPKASLKHGQVVTVKTARGDIRFVLYEQDTPATTRNFVKLATSGFYNGLKFHRVEDLVIQGGDPKGDGTGGSKDRVPLEVRKGLNFDKPYMVGMARKNQPLDSGTSQFFISKNPWPMWNGNYCAFGMVFEGKNVVDKIKKGDKMLSVTISNPTERDLKLIRAAERAKPKPEPDHDH